jgi:transcriptional regulator with XRE-family HTH domain
MRRKVKDMATATKKPRWGVVNFKQIEAKRKELGLPKSAMAENLGITNSTYHNWARGTTVPHPAQQDQIKAALDGMKGGASDGKAKRQGRKAASTPKRGTRAPKAHPERTEEPRENVAGGSIPMPSGFTPTGQPFSSPSGQSVPGIDTNSIATITAAYITSQSSKGPVTQQAVFDFISGLQKTLRATVSSEPVAAEPVSAKAEEPAAASA